MTAEPNWDEVNKDKEFKKQAVINHITSKCTSDAHIEDLRTIGACLSNGSKLHITILSGGIVNYTYCITCKDTTTDTEQKLFAKLSFPYAMFCPDIPCPLNRTENEYKMMKNFHDLSPELAATPYFCDDIGDDMKLLVTQWSPVDEQFGNQFIDGTVDLRTASKISEGIALLHCKKNVDKEFNSKMRPWFASLAPIFREIVAGLHKPDNSDRVAALAQELGEETTTDAVNSYKTSLDDTDCMIHGDLHAFNILVGAKPSISSLENFEATGQVVLCDWEISHVNCAGHDIGPLRSFPISCSFAHALNGHAQAANNCINWLDTLWSSYEEAIRQDGSSVEQVTKVFRQSLQYTAYYSICYYGINVHMEFLPTHNADDLAKVKESTGLFGLKCLNWGMDTSLSLEQLKSNYKQAIEEEIALLRKVKKVRRNRRSSMLRMSGRRVSDANLLFVNVDRVSVESADSKATLHGLKFVDLDRVSIASADSKALLYGLENLSCAQ